MPSFSDSIFLFVLALLLFGPKKLPVLARELGKWVGEFRRASNEFKMQMEDELRQVEQADRQKEIAAMEAAAPLAAVIPEPEHPHLPSSATETASSDFASSDFASSDSRSSDGASSNGASSESGSSGAESNGAESNGAESNGAAPVPALPAQPVKPLPIAVSGELSIMPPATGLPTPQRRGGGDALGGLLESIPEARPNGMPLAAAGALHGEAEPAEEAAAHGG